MVTSAGNLINDRLPQDIPGIVWLSQPDPRLHNFTMIAQLSKKKLFAGYDWTQLGDVNSGADQCECENGGVCYTLLQTSGQGGGQCVCPPRFTGPRCSLVASRCDESPCHNGGLCSDTGDTGLVCECGNTGYSGTYCHVENNSCSGQTCNNGATCLGQ